MPSGAENELCQQNYPNMGIKFYMNLKIGLNTGWYTIRESKIKFFP
jgi:hypothetical protein